MVQQMGRTHRSNQVQPPYYILPCTEIAGEIRFTSAVAARLQQLVSDCHPRIPCDSLLVTLFEHNVLFQGAMTQGNRRSTSASDAFANFDIDTRIGQTALGSLLKQLKEPAFEKYHTWLVAVDGVLDRKSGGAKVSTFLNRLLGMKLSHQKAIFPIFEACLLSATQEAKKQNQHDIGIRKIKGRITFDSSFPVYEDPSSGSSAQLQIFSVDRAFDFEAAYKIYEQERMDPDSQSCFCTYTWTVEKRTKNRRGEGTRKSSQTSTNYALALERSDRGLKAGQGGSGGSPTYMLLVRPNTGYSSSHISWAEWSNKWVSAKEEDLIGPDGKTWKGSRSADGWEEGMRKILSARHKKVHILSGDVPSF